MAYTTIDKPSDYFETKLYTGNAGTQNITGLDFQPDWIWVKDRTGDEWHNFVDSVRGTTKYLFSNATNAENTNSNRITSFNSDGFSLGNDVNTNFNSRNFASWNWKAGTSVSGNTSGAGTAKAYSGSVNTDAGFSIIKYVGNGTADHTIPHHLGVKPKMVITKNLDALIVWIVGHDSIGWDHILILNDTSAKADDVNAFNDIAPTSSVWNVGGGNGNNFNNVNYVSYCFSDVKGYSKFGSYKGNGNADGTFIYTGFKPAFIISKYTGAGQNWQMYDNKRNPHNFVDTVLFPNGNADEEAYDKYDFLSNGFKARSTSTGTNVSGGEYIYIAFAENPFTSSTGTPVTAR